MIKEDTNTAMRLAFAENLRTLRQAHNHTQSQLAAKLNVSKSCVSNYEKAVRIPTAGVIRAIAEIYGVSIEYLVGSSKRPMHYTPEDKYIDKQRYLDLNNLSPEHQRTLKELYELFREKDNH